METTETMTTKTIGKRISPRKKVLISVLMVATLTLSACARKAAEEESANGAADIEDIQGSDLKRVTLTQEAAKRIDLKTEKVKKGPGGLEIPYGAVLYDPNGKTWAFVNVSGLAFERRSITVEKIVGDVATLTKGPSEGTKVVTLGASQLFGAEIGVGDE